MNNHAPAACAARVEEKTDGAADGSAEKLRAALIKCGIAGPNLEALALTSLSPAQVELEYCQIKSDPAVRRPGAVLAKRLGEIVGVDVNRKANGRSRALAKAEQLRTQIERLRGN